MAGAETRDTIPEVLALTAAHPAIDAVVYLGLGIQSNEAQLMKIGPLLPGPRTRTDRRLPRASGHPVRRGGGGDLRGDGQARADCERACRRGAGQPRAGHRARHRPVLLPERGARGAGARAHVALRATSAAAAVMRIGRALARVLPPLVVAAVGVVALSRVVDATSDPAGAAESATPTTPRLATPVLSARRVVDELDRAGWPGSPPGGAAAAGLVDGRVELPEGDDRRRRGHRRERHASR